MTVVRCASHQARKRLFAALGREPQGVWNLDVGSIYGCYQVEEAELTKARAVNGVSVPRYKGIWLKCWS